MSTKYPESLLKLYAVHLNIIPCRHCGEYPKAHWNGFCAFAPTKYEQEPIEVAYQRQLDRHPPKAPKFAQTSGTLTWPGEPKK